MEIVPTLDRMEQIFSNAAAPAFFLGAVAAFVSLMMSRLATVTSRLKHARDQADADLEDSTEQGKVFLLERRARILGKGIILALYSAICATALLALLFTTQFFGLSHAYGSAVLFVCATVLLGLGLFRFVQESMHALHEVEADMAERQERSRSRKRKHEDGGNRPEV